MNGIFTDEQLDQLNERVPMADRRRPVVDRMLGARQSKRDLQAMHSWYDGRTIAESEKPLFVKSFLLSSGLENMPVDEKQVPELYERAGASLKAMFGKEGVHEFLGLSNEEQTHQVRAKLQADAMMPTGQAGFGVQAKKAEKPDADAVEAERTQQEQEARAQSPKVIFDELWPRMNDTARQATLKSILFKDPVSAMEAVDPLIENLPADQLRMFRDTATAIRPELEKSFTERLGPMGLKVMRRRAENAKYFVRSMGAERPGNPLGFYHAVNEAFEEDGGFEAYLANPTAEGAAKLDRLRRISEADFNQAAASAGVGGQAGVSAGKIQLSDEDVLGFYRAGKQQVEWEQRYNAVSHVAQDRYKPLPGFQEYVLQGAEISADMTALAVMTFAGNAIAPGVGTGAALATTWADHQAEMERSLIYDHGMKPVDAKLWTGVFAVPYAVTEYAQIKGFEDYALKAFTGDGRGLKIFAHYLGEAGKRWGVGTAKETGEEVVQAGIDFALKETARHLYETEGISFDGNAEEFWDETIGAVKYMWMAGLVGGQTTTAMQGMQGLATGKGMSGFFAPEARMAVRDATLPLNEFQAEVGLRRARKDFARMAEQTGFDDGVPDEVLEIVRNSKREEENPEDVGPVQPLEDRIQAMGYENPAAVIEAAEAELQVQDAANGVVIERINTLEQALEVEQGQDEFVIPENGPKFGAVEMALKSWASGLGITLDVVDSVEAYIKKYGAAPDGAKAAIINGNTVVMISSNLKSSQDAYAQFRHEVLGHMGFDLSANGADLVAKVTGLLGIDYLKARLPQYAALHEAGKLTDAGLVEEFLSVLAADLRRASVAEEDAGVLDKAKDWLTRVMGVESVARMTARDVLSVTRSIMESAFEAGTLQKHDGSQSNRALDEQEKTAEKRRKAARKQADKRVQQMAYADPVTAMVLENGGILMPKLKPGQSYPDEYAAIPKRFRGKRGKGLPLDEMTDHVAALTGNTADYSSDELRAHLEAFEQKAARILEEAETTEGTETQSAQEQDLLRALEAGEITEQQYDAAMNELVPRFSVDGNISTSIAPSINPQKKLLQEQRNRGEIGFNEYGKLAAELEQQTFPRKTLFSKDESSEYSKARLMISARTTRNGTRHVVVSKTSVDGTQNRGVIADYNLESGYISLSESAEMYPELDFEEEMKLYADDPDGYDSLYDEEPRQMETVQGMIDSLDDAFDDEKENANKGEAGTVISQSEKQPSLEGGEEQTTTLSEGQAFQGSEKPDGNVPEVGNAGAPARFSLEQHRDPERAAVISLAAEMLGGRKVNRNRVAKVLSGVGVSGSRADDVLKAVKEVVDRVKAQRSLGGDLAALIGKAEIAGHYGRQMEEAHRMGQRGGEAWQAAKDEVKQTTEERRKYARQLAVGLTSGDLDDPDHIDVSNLWKKLILQERVRKPRRADETEKEYGERLKVEGLNVEKIDIENDVYALEVKDWLYEVRRSVLRRLLRDGAPVPTAASKAFADPIVKATYMQTVENLLREKVVELTYGEKRSKLEKRIAGLDGRVQLTAYDQAVSDILFEMFNASVDQNRQQWIDAAWKLTDSVKGAIKSRQSKWARRLSGRAELMFRDVRAVMRMDEQAISDRMDALLLQLDGVDNLDRQQEIRDELAMLDRFGGLQYKKVGEIADAVTWLQETMVDEMEAQQKRVEQRKELAKGWKETILDSLPKRQVSEDGTIKGGLRNMFTRAMALKLRLNDLVRYGAPAAVDKAQKQVNDYAERISAANSRRMREENNTRAWMKNLLADLYGTKDVGPVWNDLTRAREEFAKYSDDGLKMSKTQLMQLVATFAQAEYARKAQLVLKHEAAISALAQEMGIKLADLKGTQAVAYAGMDLTKELAKREKLDEFEAGQLIYATVEEGSRLGRQYKTALRIIDDKALSDADLELIAKLREFYAKSRAPLSAVLEDITGLPIPGDMDPNYVPVRKQYMSGGLNSGGSRAPVTPAGLTRRVSNFRSFDESADILDLWNTRMMDNAQFKNFGVLHADLGVLFNDPDVLHRMEVTHGKKFTQGLITHLQDTMSGKPERTGGDSVGDLIVTAKAYTALAFSPSIGFRQWTSYPAFGYFVSGKELAGYLADVFSPEGRETFKMIIMSDWAKARRSTGNTQILNESLAKIDTLKGARKYKEFAMFTNMWGDAVPIALFGQGYYRAMRQEAARRGMSDEAEIHEWAMNKLWEVAELSQQSGSIMNRSEWQRHGGWAGRAFGQFTSTPQQYMSIQTDAWRDWQAAKASGDPERISAAKKQFVKVGFINHVLLPLGYNAVKILWNAMLGAGFDDDDAETLLVSMMVGPFSGLFIAGKIIQSLADTLVSGKNYFGTDLIPINGITEDAELAALAVRAIFVEHDPEELLSILNRSMKNNFAPYRDVSKAWKNYTD